MKIYATDVDEDALDQARQATYTAQGVEGVPRTLRERYFERGRPALRVPQGPAALGDLRPERPGPGRADLADRPAGLPQHADVLQRRDAGEDPRPLQLRAAATAAYLFLGKSEMLHHARTCSRPVDLKRRVFAKVARPDAARAAAARGAAYGADAGRRRRRTALREAAFDAGAGGPDRRRRGRRARRWPTSRRGRCSAWPRRHRPAAAGPGVSYRPVELRSAIEQACAERRTRRVGSVRVGRAGGEARDARRRRSRRCSATAARCSARASPSTTSRARRRLQRRARALQARARDRLRGAAVDRSRSSRRPTRSSSRPTRSSRRPTRSSSRPTRSSRR